ncbi:MAG: Isoniazid-inducible protein iniA [Pseudonocardiales bacterium]|nr:MAG: Isoniazid-inducible protein iniA [Pseudonocardiales bacterium]PZS38466.1 MAG: Isoniazid-inducible protein iniA [Pseudonocardiales bacterium]
MSEVGPAGLDVVDRLISLIEAGDRSDLLQRLAYTRRRLLDPTVRVLVVGEFKQGKSLLINALVDAPVCPVDDDIATALPTEVSYSKTPIATLVRGSDGASDAEMARVEVPLDELASHVSEAGNPANRQGLLRAEVGLPRQILADGLALVDTTGVGGLSSVHTTGTLAALPTADAVLLVSDASQEYSEPEIDFLRQAMKLCPNVACVLTKIDLYPQWRRISELDRVHLAGANVDADLLPVSSTLRLHSMRAEDKQLDDESGFPALVRYLCNAVAQADRLSRRSVTHDVFTVTDHLAVSLRAELQAQCNPEGGTALMAELEAAKSRAENLQRRTSRWQQTLNDGMSDLTADIEFDLRDRMRQVVRTGEAALEQADPHAIWEQFTEWLGQQLAAATSDNFVWANQRAQAIAQQVAVHFAEDGGELLPELRLGDTPTTLDAVPELAAPHADDPKLVGKLLTGMRGSYGGMLMFGMLTVLAGAASMFNPVSLAAGLVLGTKTLRDDKHIRLKRQQAEAQMLLRRQIDDVTFHVGKECRDRLRQVQRLLRDHFSDVATELQRSLTESIRAAEKAAHTEDSQRQQQINRLKAELGRIDAVRQDARALLAAPGNRS